MNEGQLPGLFELMHEPTDKNHAKEPFYSHRNLQERKAEVGSGSTVSPLPLRQKLKAYPREASRGSEDACRRRTMRSPLPSLMGWCITLSALVSVGAFPERMEESVNSPRVIEAAQYAMAHLRNLSDSGVYQSLALRGIKSAQTQEGVFHFNTFLELELASPYFKKSRATEDYHVIVMRSKADDTISYAIDKFPEMREDAIERYWIQKVEAHRLERERAFGELRKLGSSRIGGGSRQAPVAAAGM